MVIRLIWLFVAVFGNGNSSYYIGASYWYTFSYWGVHVVLQGYLHRRLRRLRRIRRLLYLNHFHIPNNVHRQLVRNHGVIVLFSSWHGRRCSDEGRVLARHSN